MKRAYARSSYAKPYEHYCREVCPGEAEQIFAKAEGYYLEFMKDMPDLGENLMAKNMLDWFTILSFYEASDHRLDGEALLKIKRQMTDKMKFLGKLVNANRQKWPYRLFERVYVKYDRQQKEHLARGEWTDSWRVEINPDRRTEGVCCTGQAQRVEIRFISRISTVTSYVPTVSNPTFMPLIARSAGEATLSDRQPRKRAFANMSCSGAVRSSST